MKKIFKSIISTTLSFALALSSSAFVKGNEHSVKLNIDGYETTVFSQNNRSYLPLEEFNQLLNIDAVYYEDTKEIVIYDYDAIILEVDSLKVLFGDNREYDLEVAPIIKDGEVYMPLTVANLLMCNVYWDNDNKTVMVNSYREQHLAPEIDEELMMQMQQDSIELMFSVLESEQFKNFVEAVTELEEFDKSVELVTQSEYLKNAVLEIAQSENMLALIELLVEMEEFEAYMKEAIQLPLYDKLVEKYGEEAMGMTDLENFDIEEVISEALEKLEDGEYLEQSFTLLKDPDYIQYMMDLYSTQSYADLQVAMMEDGEFLTLSENLANELFVSENIYLFLQSIEQSEDVKVLVEKVSQMPELEELINLYMEGIFEIMEKYELY